MTGQNEHTDWCGQDHHCGILFGEHRGEPIAIRVRGRADTVPDRGRAVLSRVQGKDSKQHAEITITIALSPADPVARWQLLTLLLELNTLIKQVSKAHPGRAA